MWVDRQSGNVATVPNTTIAVGYAISATDTTITLTSTANLRTTGFINITTNGITETIGYQNIVGNQILNAWRGQNGTVAAIHNALDPVYTNNLPCVNVWPTPSSPGNQYTLVYYRMRRLQDAGDGSNTEDMPFRFIPAIAAGLAYHIATKIPEGMSRLEMLKGQYDEQFNLAAGEDREKAAVRFVPRQMFIGGSTP